MGTIWGPNATSAYKTVQNAGTGGTALLSESITCAQEVNYEPRGREFESLWARQFFICRDFMTINDQPYLVRDPAICGGEPVVKGTRVTVRTILASLAEGMSVEEIVRDFPTLDVSAVRAVIAFAAVSAEEDLPVPPAPSLA